MTRADELVRDDAGAGVERLRNPAAAEGCNGRVRLSVLVPFYGSDPSALLRDLDRTAANLDDAVEIVCADDGFPDRRFAEAVAATAADIAVPCTLLVAARNRGRSGIRNLLAEQARGGHVLFLDGDMTIERPAFLADYLALVRRGRTGIAFGGFDMELSADDDPAHDLHVWSSRRDHCLPASERRRDPAKYAYTSNLLVRRDIVLACPFSDAFRGWGWEDVDWAMRATKLAPIEQVDNPAVHRGFSSAEVLLGKYRESVANFEVLLARHPEEVQRLPLFRAARLAARLPFPGLVLRLLSAAVLDRPGIVPMRVRDLALKLYRAWLYRGIAGRAAAGGGGGE